MVASTSQGGWAETAIRRAFDAIVTIDAEGVIEEWGEPSSRLFGYSDREAIGKRLESLVIPPDLRDAHLAGLSRLAAGGAATILDRRIEVRGLHRDGHEIPVELFVTRGTKGHYVGFVRDLSHIRAVEQQGIEMARLLVRAEELVGMGSWALDLKTGEVIWSDELFRLHGFEPGSVEPGVEYFLERLHPDDRERVRALVARVVADPVALLDTDLHFDYRFVLADGSLREMQARGRVEQDGDGRPTRFVGASQDMTGQRLSERELQAHYAIGQALRDWESFDEGIVRLLQRIGTALELAIGTLWVLDSDTTRLRCRAYWSAPGVELQSFEEAAWTAELRPGVGTPGLAWTTQLPVVTDRLDDDAFQRSGEVARASGMRSGVAFPALSERGPVVVLAFYSFDRIEPREQLERTLIGIGRELGRFLESRRIDFGPPLLSPRELEVLTLAADGISGPEIARRLFLAPSTVKTHFEKIYDKLGVSDRPAAVAYGLRAGLFK